MVNRGVGSYHSHIGVSASAGPKGCGSLKLAWPSLRNVTRCCRSRRATTEIRLAGAVNVSNDHGDGGIGQVVERLAEAKPPCHY